MEDGVLAWKTRRGKICRVQSPPGEGSIQGIVSYPKQALFRRSRSRESMGCGTGCLIHLMLLGLLFAAFLMWCINNRAWELVITFIFPE